ncbi:hypothetical protein [Bacillus sp. H2FL2]|uniref:hypothetical protein n=1 Tax=Bacillus sp. H2FL2 TaxID=2994531 RepID=UPI00224B784B|nr:hypothetical protein [Bacillus sp. H2FL2]MCX2773135.1 hypothetical protein [Bacillus sp. H2FL2]
MARYRKKPVEVEAVKFEDTAHSITDISNLAGGRTIVYSYQSEYPTLTIQNLEGDMTAQVGDYIIRGIKGELYLCKPDIFEKTYERVNESNGGI